MAGLFYRCICPVSILAGTEGTKTPRHPRLFDSKEEAVRHYEYLKQIYQSISAKEIYSPYVFPLGKHRTHPFGNRSQNGIYHLMTNNSALKDDLAAICPLDTYMRAGWIGVVSAPPTSPHRKNMYCNHWGDRSQDVREEAYKVLSEMTLSPEQNQKVEELLRFKYSEKCASSYQSADETAQRTVSRHPPLANRQGCRTPPGRIGYDEDHTQCRIPARYLHQEIDPDS